MSITTRIASRKNSFPAVYGDLLGKAYLKNGALYRDFEHPNKEFEVVGNGNAFFVSFNSLVHCRQQPDKDVGFMVPSTKVLSLVENDDVWWSKHQNAALTAAEPPRFGLAFTDSIECMQYLKAYWNIDELDDVGLSSDFHVNQLKLCLFFTTDHSNRTNQK